jgi:transposase
MEMELRTNARSATTEEQYQIRKNIVRLLKEGKSGREIAKLLDVSEGHVSNVKKAYTESGIQGIQIGKRGRRNGEKRTLTPGQEKEIMRTIVDKTPEQLRLPGCMWTRENIRQLIGDEYGINMPLSTLGYYLQRWGFSVQRPSKRAYKQDEKQINAWLNEEFPGIRARARSENAEIFFGDETGLQNTANYARGYSPIGHTPVVRVESKKMKINMLSAISKRGKLRFMLYKDTMNTYKLINFMWRLVRDTDKKVFLILDNLRVHHSKKVMVWLEKHKDKIEVFYLPPYAPEYNPDELLNSDLKRGIGNRAMPRSEDDLEYNVRSHLKGLQLNPVKICSFFAANFTAYAS